MNYSETLFKELTSNEEASMSGAKKLGKNQTPKNQPKNVTVNFITFNGDINGAGGGAASGGSIGGNSGSPIGGSGVVLDFR